MLKKRVEALLFTSQDGFTLKELSERLGVGEKALKRILEELREEFEDRGFKLSCDGGRWRMIVNPELTHVVKELAPAELPKALMETLAVIAYLSPTTQAEVIRIRGNKAYEHVRELCEMGFITAKPWKRTLKIGLTQKFYQYFELRPGEEKRLLSRG
ncbi:MAG TPA: SMC-Scp complex subunit ScpB [Candidatus Aenigmarchaeota archaeon]|nr:SMC-Scp complex subunit ScpB [Candidatus Aenigmarchaeota archaeon]